MGDTGDHDGVHEGAPRSHEPVGESPTAETGPGRPPHTPSDWLEMDELTHGKPFGGESRHL